MKKKIPFVLLFALLLLGICSSASALTGKPGQTLNYSFSVNYSDFGTVTDVLVSDGSGSSGIQVTNVSASVSSDRTTVSYHASVVIPETITAGEYYFSFPITITVSDGIHGMRYYMSKEDYLTVIGPTPAPTAIPTLVPTEVPTPIPTEQPTQKPTSRPEYTRQPELTRKPEPTKRPEPTRKPESTRKPTPTRRPEPTRKPVPSPAPVRTPAPTRKPTPKPMQAGRSMPQPTIRAADQNFIYRVLPSGSVEIMEYIGKEAILTLPETLDGKIVAGIGHDAFYEADYLEEITLSKHIRHIGHRAFYRCKNLKKVTLPEGLLNVGNDAFGWCESLMVFDMPESVIGIGDGVFYECKSLERVTMPPYVSHFGMGMFFHCPKITSITIPDGVTALGDMFFTGCTSLRSINLPTSVSEFGRKAFYGCDALIYVWKKDAQTGTPYDISDEIFYMQGEEYEKKGDWKRAFLAFEKANNYGDAPERILRIQEAQMQTLIAQLQKSKIGEVFKFGRYEQDNNLTNGKEEIEWQVLDKKNGRILVISRYGLDCKLYHTKEEGITWEKCSLRKWLNNKFINVAFSAEEQRIIPPVIVPADPNPEFMDYANPGKATQDQIFLLSISEVNKYFYFSSNETRLCTPTPYADSNGVYNSENGHCWWWLRSPGYDQYTAAFVDHRGGIDANGSDVYSGLIAVRPALWIDPESFNP